MDDLLAEFIAETRDTLEALSGEIIAWEANPGDRARLDSIFRFVHTVKGSCGFLDLPRFERLSHAAEDVLAEVRSGARQPDARMVSAVLAVIDRIGELTEALDAGESIADTDDAMLIAALSADLPAQAAAPAAAQAAAAPRAPTRSIRIPLDLLDQMMSGVSDMVLARNELSRRLRAFESEPGLSAAFDRLSACVADMRDSITRSRMQRIDKLFAALPRMVRDTAAELGKRVDLRIEGGNVELDREMIELIRDPLTHMIRNAIDHGVESPDERRAARKPEAGRLTVSAHQSGNQIVIEIADDGRGIDEARLAAKAVSLGVISADAADAMTSSQRAGLIFAPGLSTADRISAISGRGVGMDVVRANIERIGGVIDIDNRPRAGLRLTIRVPLTLTIISALTVTAGNQGFAIPRSAIEEIVHDSNEMIRIDTLGSARVMWIRDRALPVVDLEDVLGLPRNDDPAIGRTLALVRGVSGGAYALGVAAVHDHEELVIKPASPAIAATGVYAGMSLPDSGVPVLLLDISGIAEAAGVRAEDEEPVTAQPAAEAIEPEALVQTLLFRGFDGVRRGVRLGLVERIEDVSGDRVRFAGGRLRIAIDDQILPLAGFEIMADRPSLKILRLTDGDAELAYAVEEVIDIIALADMGEPAAEAGPIASVALVAGEQVEILDPFWLFGEAAGRRPRRDKAPLCLLADADDRWTREILRPLVEAAGYRVALAGEVPAAEADVVIASGGDVAEPTGGAQIVRLRAEPKPTSGDNSVYRYDRAGLLAAIRKGAVAAR